MNTDEHTQTTPHCMHVHTYTLLTWMYVHTHASVHACPHIHHTHHTHTQCSYYTHTHTTHASHTTHTPHPHHLPTSFDVQLGDEIMIISIIFPIMILHMHIAYY